MKSFQKYRQLLLGAGLTLVLGMAAWDSVAAGERCYANWSEAAPVVASEKLVAARDIQKLVSNKTAAKIVRITLCKAATGYEYRMVVFEPGGKPRKITLDARKPVVP